MNRVNSLKEIYKTIDTGTAEGKLKSLPPFPKIVEFEITNHCNFNCIMCPTGIGTAKRTRGYMTDEVFDKVIDEISKYNIALKFVGQGETLLHPNAIIYIRRAKEKGIITHLTTNGSLLTHEMMDEFVNMGLDSIKFSFQGVDADGYLLLRQKDNFSQLMDVIKQLHDIRGDKEKPYITIGTSVVNEEKQEIEKFINFGNLIADKVEIGITNLETSDLSLIKNTIYRSKLEEIQKRQTGNKKRYICCPQVFDTITVRWNGDISACCGDVDGLMTLGNIQNKSIKECWDSDKENMYRQILAKGRYEDIEACKDCYDVYGWTYGESNYGKN